MTASDPLDALEGRLRRRERRVGQLARHVLYGSGHPVYRALVVAWGIAVAARATLAQVSGPGWWTAQLLLFAGVVLLWRFGGRVGWAVSLVGLLIPLLLLRDWMTQTTLLTAIAVVGLLTTRGELPPDRTLGRAEDDPDGGSDAPAPLGPPPAVVPFAAVLVICTYAVAVFHKLNRDFFDAELSCAVYGWAKLDRLTPRLPLVDLPPSLLHAALLTAELALVWLLWRRHLRAALVVGPLFHLPLTIALAPAFAFTMGIGYAARLRPDELVALRRGARRHGGGALALGILVAVATTWAAGVLPIWHLLIKIVFLVALAWVALRTALPSPVLVASGRGGARWPGIAAVVLMGILAALPYLGTRVQHAGAMLSNLRVDAGCWNHLIVPERVRRVDPYLRIDSAHVGGERYRALGLHARREAALLEGLWGDDALAAIRRNWCRPHTRPIRLTGTLRGEPIHIEDLCADDVVLPRARGAFGGPAIFPNHLRFQTTLRRDCRQVCVH